MNRPLRLLAGTRQQRSDTVIAWGAVALLHLLLFRGIATLRALPAVAAEHPLDVVFLMPPPQVKPKRLLQAALPPPEQPHPTLEHVRPRHAADEARGSPKPDALEATTLSPVAPLQGDDHWSAAKRDVTVSDFAARKPWERASNQLAPITPDRFRMRKVRTPEDVLKGAAQFMGLWPPGYHTESCPDIERAANDLASSTSAESRRQLAFALELEQRFCR